MVSEFHLLNQGDRNNMLWLDRQMKESVMLRRVFAQNTRLVFSPLFWVMVPLLSDWYPGSCQQVDLVCYPVDF